MKIPSFIVIIIRLLIVKGRLALLQSTPASSVALRGGGGGGRDDWPTGWLAAAWLKQPPENIHHCFKVRTIELGERGRQSLGKLHEWRAPLPEPLSN